MHATSADSRRILGLKPVAERHVRLTSLAAGKAVRTDHLTGASYAQPRPQTPNLTLWAHPQSLDPSHQKTLVPGFSTEPLQRAPLRLTSAASPGHRVMFGKSLLAIAQREDTVRRKD